MASFKIIKRQRRIIALTQKAKVYMWGKTCSLSNPEGHLDMVQSKNMIEWMFAQLSHDRLTAEDGNGKRIKKFVYENQ